MQIDVDALGRDQRVNVIGVYLTKRAEEFGQVQSRSLLDQRQHRLGNVLFDRGRLGQVVIQETQIALEDPVDLARKAQGVPKVQLRGEPLAWWASPVARGISVIAVRHGLAKPLETFVSLPFLPANGVGSKHKVTPGARRRLVSTASPVGTRPEAPTSRPTV